MYSKDINEKEARKLLIELGTSKKRLDYGYSNKDSILLEYNMLKDKKKVNHFDVSRLDYLKSCIYIMILKGIIRIDECQDVIGVEDTIKILESISFELKRFKEKIEYSDSTKIK